jgi:5-methylcytosine-specific restriction endonuclease McrA
MRKSVSKSLRKKIVERAKGYCEYCYCPEWISSSSFSSDHILPVSLLDGKNILSNLANCCQNCNNHKYNKLFGFDQITGKQANLYNPREDSWQEHFAWSENGLLILGISPKGRATVSTLRLNRTRVVNLRQVLFNAGKHPPAFQVSSK